MSAEFLSEALSLANETGPWVVVSAGTGSFVSRIFSARHGPSQVLGLMFVDPASERVLDTIASPSRGLGIWLRGVTSPFGIPLLSGAVFRGRTRADRVYGPQSSRYTGKYLFARLQENLAVNMFTREEVSTAQKLQDRSVPVAVVSSELKMQTDPQWKAVQQDMTTLTDKLVGWWVAAKGTPHAIWETQTGAREMSRALRKLLDAIAAHGEGRSATNME